MTRLVRFMASVALLAATTTTVQADIAWTTGAPNGTSGGALLFTGPDENDNTASGNGGDFLATGIANEIQGGDYTVSFWLNVADVTRQQYAVGTTNRSLHLGLNNGGQAFQGHWGSDHQGASSVIADNTWFHATFTYDADGGVDNGGPVTPNTGPGLGTIFINGVQVGQDSRNAPNFPNNEILLGTRFNNGDSREQLQGSLDDVAFFNSVVSGTDIAALAAGTTDALALGANAYYDFEDDQFGTTAAVQSADGVTAFGNTLTAITATAIPEPSSLAIMLGLGVAGLTRRKRS